MSSDMNSKCLSAHQLGPYPQPQSYCSEFKVTYFCKPPTKMLKWWNSWWIGGVSRS